MVVQYISLGLTIFLVLAIICILLIPRILYGKLNYNNGKKRDCIIILGYRVPDSGVPSPILIERIKMGIKLYENKIAPKIICSGGASGNQHIEADIIYNQLVKYGIPKEDIICETDSKGTWGNIKYSKKIMKDCGFESAVIVSTPEHLRRASIYSARMNIDCTVERADIPKEYVLLFCFGYIYVYYGIIKYLLNKHKYIE